MAYELIFGEYASSPTTLIEKLNDWEDVDNFSNQVRIRLGDGEEAVKEREMTIAKLEQWARDARQSDRLQSALKYVQDAAQMRGAFTEPLLRQAVEICVADGQLERAVSYCSLAQYYYVVESSSWYDDMVDKLGRKMGPAKPLSNLKLLSSDNLFPLFDYFYCVESGTVNHHQKFLSEIAKNRAVMAVFREADFAKMSLDDLHLVISFLTVVRRLGEDANSMTVDWFSQLVFALNENAVSVEGLRRLARSQPGAFDRFFGEILGPMYSEVSKKRQMPLFYFDLKWYSHVAVMFAVCGTKPKEGNLETQEQMGAMEWSAMQSEKLFEMTLQSGDAIEAELELFADQRSDLCRKTFDLLALSLAASFAEWKCVLSEPLASNEERNRNRTGWIFKRFTPFLDVLTHAHVKGPPLSTLIRQYLLSIHLEMAKETLFFASKASLLTELSRKCLFPACVRYIFQAMTFAKCPGDLASFYDFEPFRRRFLDASRFIFTTTPKSLIKSEIFDQFMLIIGRLGSASPRFLEQTLPFANAFFQRYKHEDALHCITLVLRTASKDQLKNWANQSGEIFVKIAAHFYLLLMSQISNLLQAERLLNLLLAIGTLVANKMVPATEIFGHLSAQRIVFVDKMMGLITGRDQATEESCMAYGAFIGSLAQRPLVAIVAGLTLAIFWREDEKIRQLCLKSKHRSRAIKKLRQEIELVSSSNN